MKEITWKDEYIEIPKPSNPKKITGTRFAAILGFSKWATPFATWCDITRTYEKPYEDTIYTAAGKIIEPIQHQFLRDYYKLNLTTPEDAFGKNYFEITKGDFYPSNKIFGGMWDALVVNNSKVDAVVEFKTTKRVEDWQNDIPDYYGLQASLYAYLLGVEKVIMVCSFLEPTDYDNPALYKPSINNTIVKIFNVHERYPEFDSYIERATHIYNSLNISPYFDREDDALILKQLQTESVSENADITALIDKMAEIKTELDKYNNEIEPLQKTYKSLQEQIKAMCMLQFKDNVNRVVARSKSLTVSVDKTVKKDIDKKRLEADHLLEKYTIEKEIYTLRVKEEK